MVGSLLWSPGPQILQLCPDQSTHHCKVQRLQDTHEPVALLPVHLVIPRGLLQALSLLYR